MAFKLLLEAEKCWRRANSLHLVPLVHASVEFPDGKTRILPDMPEAGLFNSRGEAVGRVVDLAAYVGTRAHIFHVTCDEAVQQIAQARQRGLPISGETCPQYLLWKADWLPFIRMAFAAGI